MKIAGNLSRLLRSAIAALLVGVLLGCGATPVADKDGRIYHCVSTSRPVPPPNTLAQPWPLEKFEYGDYVTEDRPTTGRSGYCSVLTVPKTAYLRYRVDGRVIEKRFDLSALTAQRVHNKTVEFFVDGDTVEVRVMTPVRGALPSKEVIVRQ